MYDLFKDETAWQSFRESRCIPSITPVRKETHNIYLTFSNIKLTANLSAIRTSPNPTLTLLEDTYYRVWHHQKLMVLHLSHLWQNNLEKIKLKNKLLNIWKLWVQRKTDRSICHYFSWQTILNCPRLSRCNTVSWKSWQ